MAQARPGPATEAQMAVLRKIMPRAKNLRFMSKQKASEILERFFAARKQETMQRQETAAATQRRSQLTSALKHLD